MTTDLKLNIGFRYVCIKSAITCQLRAALAKLVLPAVDRGPGFLSHLCHLPASCDSNDPQIGPSKVPSGHHTIVGRNGDSQPLSHYEAFQGQTDQK